MSSSSSWLSWLVCSPANVKAIINEEIKDEQQQHSGRMIKERDNIIERKEQSLSLEQSKERLNMPFVVTSNATARPIEPPPFFTKTMIPTLKFSTNNLDSQRDIWFKLLKSGPSSGNDQGFIFIMKLNNVVSLPSTSLDKSEEYTNNMKEKMINHFYQLKYSKNLSSYDEGDNSDREITRIFKCIPCKRMKYAYDLISCYYNYCQKTRKVEYNASVILQQKPIADEKNWFSIDSTSLFITVQAICREIDSHDSLKQVEWLPHMIMYFKEMEKLQNEKKVVTFYDDNNSGNKRD